LCFKGNSDKGTSVDFSKFGTVKQQVMDLDPNVQRSILVYRTLEIGISCYRKFYEEKNKATSVETTL
jgi:hypothetical protein